jgi:hypothetical protein
MTRRAIEAARIQTRFFQQRVRVFWTAVAIQVCVTASGALVWFTQEPRDRTGLQVGVLVMGAVAGLWVAWISYVKFVRPSAKCPECGCDWIRESGENPEKWLMWDKCPGCGIKIRGPADYPAKPLSEAEWRSGGRQ